MEVRYRSPSERGGCQGHKVPLTIDTEAELQKIIEESDIDELIQAIREHMD